MVLSKRNLLTDWKDVCTPYLTRIWNNGITEKHQFPDNLKLADVTPVFKKEDRNLVNYRHVNVLTVIWKIFERKLHKQIVSYIDTNIFLHINVAIQKVPYTTGIKFNKKRYTL